MTTKELEELAVFLMEHRDFSVSRAYDFISELRVFLEQKEK